MSEFINFYLKSEEDKLKKKWKIIDHIIQENDHQSPNKKPYKNETKYNKEYFTISKLKEILKKSRK